MKRLTISYKEKRKVGQCNFCTEECLYVWVIKSNALPINLEVKFCDKCLKEMINEYNNDNN